MEIHDEIIVQYFELARFEWRPDLAEEHIVRVSDLGYPYYFATQEDIVHLSGETRNFITSSPFPTELQVSTTTSPESVHQGEEVILNVKVQDQFYIPVNDALIVYMVRFPMVQRNFSTLGLLMIKGNLAVE